MKGIPLHGHLRSSAGRPEKSNHDRVPVCGTDRCFVCRAPHDSKESWLEFDGTYYQMIKDKHEPQGKK